jgi:hypothetical protein
MALHRWLIPAYTTVACLAVGALLFAASTSENSLIHLGSDWTTAAEIAFVCLAISASLSVPSIFVLRRDDRALARLRELNPDSLVLLATADKQFDDAVEELDIDYFQSPSKPFSSSIGIIADRSGLAIWTVGSMPEAAYRISWDDVGPITTGYTKLRNIVGPQAIVRPALKIPVRSAGQTVVITVAVTSTLSAPAGGSVEKKQLLFIIDAIEQQRSISKRV